MAKLPARVTMPALLMGAALGISAGPALAMSYTPGTYQLTVVPGTYLSESGQTSGGGCVGTPGMGGTCPYIPADFAHSDVENSGAGTVYGFYFMVGAGTTDYLNVSEGSTGTIEGFDITTYTYMTGTPPSTPLTLFLLHSYKMIQPVFLWHLRQGRPQ